MKIMAVTTQKNEGAFLLEEIAYHKIIWFTDILILSNDREDGSYDMLYQLSNSGEIIHLRNIMKSVDPAEFFRRRGFCPRLQP